MFKLSPCLGSLSVTYCVAISVQQSLKHHDQLELLHSTLTKVSGVFIAGGRTETTSCLSKFRVFCTNLRSTVPQSLRLAVLLPAASSVQCFSSLVDLRRSYEILRQVPRSLLEHAYSQFARYAVPGGALVFVEQLANEILVLVDSCLLGV